jgi:hypothetical protein
LKTVTVRRQNVSPSNPNRNRRNPATTPEARESQLVAKAERLAERQLDDGTASAQVITHYLKLGSTREQLEQRRLAGEVELQKAKIEAMASTQRLEAMYAKAMDAFRGYQGVPSEDVDDGYGDG